MSYTKVQTKITSDEVTAPEWNIYIRDNFASGVPDIFQTKGDLPIALDADLAGILPIGADGQFLTPDHTQPTGIKWIDLWIPKPTIGGRYLRSISAGSVIWDVLPIPDYGSSQLMKYLRVISNGSGGYQTSWEDAPRELPLVTGNSGKFLHVSSTSSMVEWVDAIPTVDSTTKGKVLHVNEFDQSVEWKTISQYVNCGNAWSYSHTYVNGDYDIPVLLSDFSKPNGFSGPRPQALQISIDVSSSSSCLPIEIWALQNDGTQIAVAKIAKDSMQTVHVPLNTIAGQDPITNGGFYVKHLDAVSTTVNFRVLGYYI